MTPSMSVEGSLAQLAQVSLRLLPERGVSGFVAGPPRGLVEPFDLGPVLSDAADSRGWTAVDDAFHTRRVVLSPPGRAARSFDGRYGWKPLGGRRVAWTDDYSSVLL